MPLIDPDLVVNGEILCSGFLEEGWTERSLVGISIFYQMCI